MMSSRAPRRAIGGLWARVGTLSPWVVALLAAVMVASWLGNTLGGAVVAQAAPNTKDSTVKTAYKVNADGSTTPLTNPDGTALTSQPTVTPGDKITFVIQDARTGTKNDIAPRNLTDTMTGLNYVPNSLTTMNTGAGLDNGLTMIEPGSNATWSSGQKIATFNPTAGKFKYLKDGTTPMAQPLFGQNAQTVTVTNTTVNTTPIGSGDGFNPTFVYNGAGQLLVWTANHHISNFTIPCEVVGTHQDCSAGALFTSNFHTIQDSPTTVVGSKGYFMVQDGTTQYVACVDFTNATAGTPPVACGAPVPFISGATDGSTAWYSSGIWQYNGKLYALSDASSGSGWILGCYDPSTNAVCAGFAAGGTPIKVNSTYNSGNVNSFNFLSTIQMPNGGLVFTSDWGGSAAFCVNLSGNTLVDCNDANTGATTPGITPIATGTNAGDALPVINAAGTGTVPAGGETTSRVTGFCLGPFDGYAKSCYAYDATTGKTSTITTYPNLLMYQSGGLFMGPYTRENDAFAYVDGAAIMIYPVRYDQDGGRGGCYNFATSSPCAASPNPYNYSRVTGETWNDVQQINNTKYYGSVYGARMIPNTANCMVTYGDHALYLYWKVDPTTGVITQNPDGSGCIPIQAAFQNPSTRYCGPTSGGQAGVKAWDDLVISETATSSGAAKNVDTNLVLNYYAFDPATGARGALLGTVTVPGGSASATVPVPSFLTYSTVKNFIVEVKNPTTDSTYTFTQYNTSDFNPAVCYQATVPDNCSVGTTGSATNQASWTGTGSTASNTVKINITYSGCLDLAKTAGATVNGQALTVTGPDPNGVYTAYYTISVKNTHSVSATYSPITDTLGFTSGTAATGASFTLNGGTSTVLTGSGPYTLGTTTNTLAAGATDTYVISVTFTLSSGQTASVTQCASTPTSGQGLYNSAAVTGDTTPNNNAACDTPPAPPASWAVAKSAAGGQPGGAGTAVQVTADPKNPGSYTATATYTVVVTNTGGSAATAPAITDQVTLPTGFTVTSITLNGTAVTVTNGSFAIPASTTDSVAPGGTRSYTVVVVGTTNSLDTINWTQAGTCNTSGNGIPKDGGFFNLVTLANDTDGTANNDACVPVTPPTTTIQVAKLGTNCDANAAACALPGSQFAIYGTDPTTGQMASTPLMTGAASGGSGSNVYTSQSLTYPGTYYLVETQAPKGFVLLAQPVQFTLNGSGGVTWGSGKSAFIDSTGTTANGSLVVNVHDATPSKLPAAGGQGPMPFAAVALLLLAGAGTYYAKGLRAAPARRKW